MMATHTSKLVPHTLIRFFRRKKFCHNLNVRREIASRLSSSAIAY